MDKFCISLIKEPTIVFVEFKCSILVFSSAYRKDLNNNAGPEKTKNLVILIYLQMYIRIDITHIINISCITYNLYILPNILILILLNTN